MSRILLSLLLVCCTSGMRAQTTVVDVDGSGRFTVADIDALAQRALHFQQKDVGSSPLVGDMNRDGRLDVADVTLLTDAALHPVYTLPYESAVLNDWVVVDGAASSPWLKGEQYVQATGYQAWDGDTRKSNRKVDGYLISPAFCTHDCQGGVTMSFDDVIRYTDKDAAYEQHVKIYASATADGTSFVPSEWTELDWTVSHVRNDWTFTTTDVALPAEFVGKDHVRIAFWFCAPSTGSSTFEFNNFKLCKSEDEGGGDDPEPPLDPDDLNSNTISLAGSYVNTETGTASSTYIGRIELPRLCSDDTFIVHQDTELSGSPVNYSIAYNEAKRHSHWVAYRFDDEVGCKNTSRSGSFKVDPLIDTSAQSATSYVTGSGYDRGHLCSSNDRTATETGNGQTFYMSNMSPQLSSFNQVYWQKYENHLISLVRTNTSAVPTTYRKAFADTVYVVKGGTIDDDKLNGYMSDKAGTQIPVPKYYYMALLKVKNGEYSAIGFWMEHKEYPKIDSKLNKQEILAHAVTIDELERLTGIDFFCNLPASIETVVEASYVAADWEL